MKITIVHNDYQQPGGEYAAVEADIFLLHKHNHDLLQYRKDNHEINNYGSLQRLGMIPDTILSKSTYKEIRSLVAEYKPDVAHVHNVFPLLSPAVYRGLHDSGVPIVQTIHNFRFLCPNGLFFTKGHVCERCKFGNTIHSTYLKCYRSSYLASVLYALSIGLHRGFGTFQLIDHFIALSGFSAHKMIESGLANQDKISVLGNFISENIPVQKSMSNLAPYVVYFGRLSQEKDVATLVKAIDGISNLQLKIAGTGPQKDELKQLVQKLGLQQVEFLGYVSGNNKWDLLREATATILPSVCYENLPFAVLESLAVGTPMIASNIGSLPYIIKDSYTGLLFQPGNSDDLRDKIVWIVNHPEEAKNWGKNGQQLIAERYSEDAHYRGLMNIYRDVIEKQQINNIKLQM